MLTCVNQRVRVFKTVAMDDESYVLGASEYVCVCVCVCSCLVAPIKLSAGWCVCECMFLQV